jgi:hypothetical protein
MQVSIRNAKKSKNLPGNVGPNRNKSKQKSQKTQKRNRVQEACVIAEPCKIESDFCPKIVPGIEI